MYFHNIIMASKIKKLFTLPIILFQIGAILSPILVFSVGLPLFNFQINRTAGVLLASKSNNDQT